MGMDQVVRIDRLTPDLGVEIETARRETAALQHLMKYQRKLRYVHRELVSIPAEQIVAAVDVERAEDAERLGEHDLVVERMARQDGVVLLDVELDVFQQVVALQEAVAGGDVEIILVLGRLFRLRLDQDRSVET